MKTIDLPDAPPKINGLLDQAGDDDLIVRHSDGREFLLVAVDAFDDEVARTRANPRLMTLLDERTRRPETIPLDEVKRRLGL